MSKQSSIEWLIEKLLDSGIGISKQWREQAKQMHKEEIEDAYNQDLYGGLSKDRIFDNGADYYQETYGGNNEQSVTNSNDLSSPKEISDEEIHKAATNYSSLYYEFRAGAQWYREQLKNK